MLSAFSAFNLLIVILPSTLYAEIHPEHREILTKANKNLHLNLDLHIYQISSVSPFVWATREPSVQYMIYGTDKYTKRPYMDLWSIGDNGDPIINWALQNFKKKVTTKDESLTITVTVPNTDIFHGTKSTSGEAETYHLTFDNGDAYDDFMSLLREKKSGLPRLCRTKSLIRRF